MAGAGEGTSAANDNSSEGLGSLARGWCLFLILVEIGGTFPACATDVGLTSDTALATLHAWPEFTYKAQPNRLRKFPSCGLGEDATHSLADALNCFSHIRGAVLAHHLDQHIRWHIGGQLHGIQHRCTAL